MVMKSNRKKVFGLTLFMVSQISPCVLAVEIYPSEIPTPKLKVEIESAEVLPTSKIQDKTPNAIKLREKLPSRRANLGIAGQAISQDLASHLDIKHGVIVNYVLPGSAAEKYKILSYDVITTLHNQPVTSVTDLKNILLHLNSGDEVELNLVRKGKHLLHKVVLGVPYPDELEQKTGNNLSIDPNNGDPRMLLKDMGVDDHDIKKILKQFNVPQKGYLDMKQDPTSLRPSSQVLGKVTYKDNMHSILLKLGESGTEIEVKDNEGVLLYDGELDALAEAGLPDSVYGKIKTIEKRYSKFFK